MLRPDGGAISELASYRAATDREAVRDPAVRGARDVAASLTGREWTRSPRIDLRYPGGIATATVGIGAKAEGDLVIAGTEGYLYVPGTVVADRLLRTPVRGTPAGGEALLREVRRCRPAVRDRRVRLCDPVGGHVQLHAAPRGGRSRWPGIIQDARANAAGRRHQLSARRQRRRLGMPQRVPEQSGKKSSVCVKLPYTGTIGRPDASVDASGRRP